MSKGLSHNYIGYTCGDVDGEHDTFKTSIHEEFSSLLDAFIERAYSNCVHISVSDIEELLDIARSEILNASDEVVVAYKKNGTELMRAEFDYALGTKEDEIEDLKAEHSDDIDELERKIEELESRIDDLNSQLGYIDSAA